MNIIKQFDDHEFFERHHCTEYDDADLAKGYWRWGLGDDGELYCQCSAFIHKAMDSRWKVPSHFNDPNEWYPYSEACWPGQYHVDFQDMIKIVREFGKLLVWL